MTYRWNFDPIFDNPDVLLRGAFGTLRLFAICAIVGLALGLLVGLARQSPRRWLRPEFSRGSTFRAMVVAAVAPVGISFLRAVQVAAAMTH